MSTKAITIRLDENTATEVQRFAKSVGLSTSAFATVVLKQAARDQKIVLTSTLIPTPYLESVLRETGEKIQEDYRNMTSLETANDVEAFFDKVS